MPLKRDELAADFMVQCEKGEPFECPHLADCPHEDKDLCLWQYEHADRIIEAHKAVIRKIKKELKSMICKEFESPDGKPELAIFMSPKEWQAFWQKYGGKDEV